jgi:Carboxypeptidase regulatory-like domain
MCRTRSLGVLAALAVIILGLVPAMARAQSAQSSSLVGKVTDESGAAMPGVTVTASSPQLQVGQKTAVTGVEGDYRILELTPGTYKVTFELAGFQTNVREDLHLTVGLAGRVDVTMKIGGLEETIQVSGISPVVDTVNVTGQTTLLQEQLRTIPMGGTMQEMLPLAAGISMQSKPDVGDSNLAARSAIITYGVVLQPTLDVEGINTTTDHAADTAVYLNSFSLEEVQFKTSGNNADIAFPGVAQVAVLKSGSNVFHGSARGSYENPSWQSNNVTPELAAQGITNTNPIVDPGYYESLLDLGGHIIKDKLWFYGAYSKQAVTQGAVGFVGAPNADGCWFVTCGGTTPATTHTDLPGFSVKVSYQLNSKTKLIATDMYALKHLSQNGGSTTTPLPSARYQRQPGSAWKGEMQSSPSAKLLVNVLAGHGGYHVNYIDQPAFNVLNYPDGTDVPGNPTTRETSNSLNTGPAINPEDRPQNRYEAKGYATYIPAAEHLGGTHQLKVGTTLDWEFAGTRILEDKKSGDYQLQFTRGVPSQIVIYNYPFATSINNLYSQAFYVTDSYGIGRVTLNLGVRWERYHNFTPAQSKEAGQFSNIFPAQSFPKKDVLTWTDTVPRAGAAWDVTGNGRTVIKGSFGMFGDTMGDLFSNAFNSNAQATQTYAWTGPCVTTPYKNNSFNNTSCDVTPDFLATLPSLTPVSATGGINSDINPDLKQNKTYEYTVRLERELVPNVAVSAGFVYHKVKNIWITGYQYQRPYSTWIPAEPTAPFIDGLTGAPVTIYTYPASEVGAAFNRLKAQNAMDDRPDTFQSYEVAITKRYSKKWTGSASFWTTQNHQWIASTTVSAAMPQSPNDDRFPTDDTKYWEGRANVTYSFPWGINASMSYRSQSGAPGQRTQSFTAANTVLRQGTVTLRMGPYGEYHAPAVQIVAIRAAKNISVGGSKKVELSFQLFNAMNSSGITSVNYLTGTQFGQVTGITSGRVARIGAAFTF